MTLQCYKFRKRVQFGKVMQFSSKAKNETIIDILGNGGRSVRENYQKTLILALEVIVLRPVPHTCIIALFFHF